MFFGLPDPGMALFLAETPTRDGDGLSRTDWAILAAPVLVAILALFAAA